VLSASSGIEARAPLAKPRPGLSRLGLTVLLCGAVLPLMDFFIVNVALPTIDSDLAASGATLELVVAGYGVAYALLLIVGGRLGDAYGRCTVFNIGLAGFTVASLLCGLAPSVDWLVAARIAQGVAGALVIPQVLATFQATLDGERRVKALGLYAATAGTSAVAGQLIGGLLVTADIAGQSWRPIFLVNVPIGLVVLGLAPRIVPNTRSENPASVDLPGTALLGLSLITLLVPLTEGRTLGWPWWTWLVLAVSPIAAGALWRVEQRTERRGSLPVLPPSLLRLRSVRRGAVLGAPFQCALADRERGTSLVDRCRIRLERLPRGRGVRRRRLRRRVTDRGEHGLAHPLGQAEIALG
jgi:MFS family permease